MNTAIIYALAALIGTVVARTIALERAARGSTAVSRTPLVRRLDRLGVALAVLVLTLLAAVPLAVVLS